MRPVRLARQSVRKHRKMFEYVYLVQGALENQTLH